jgi:tungstate transport system substrate-binding protein
MRAQVTPILIALLSALAGCGDGGDSDTPTGSGSAERDRPVVLATTTSTQDSGLLDELVPAFERESGYQVKTIAVGSGEAIELGSRGEADVLLVHSPDAEEELMARGKAAQRRLVMHNDFVIAGSADDPASIRGAGSPTDALTAIAEADAPFVSRGDDSGTHALELELWEEAGVKPAGDWYEETGQGMGATLRIADQRRAYTLADRGTYLSTSDSTDLDVLVEGDPSLLNIYHVIDVAPDAGPRVNAEGGRAFARWIVSREAQRTIGRFGRAEFGRPLFVPDAGRTEQQVVAAGG